jgi:hypothetical protein
MKIPLDFPHWPTFYFEAKKQGASISSRFVGVYAKMRGNHPFWVARYQRKGFEKFLGHFSFSKDGEMRAAQAYSDYRKKVEGQNGQLNHKGRITKKIRL